MRHASIRPRTLAAGLSLAALFLLSVTFVARAAETQDSERHAFKLVEVAGGLDSPWGLAFLPEGDILVTEKPGRLRLIRDGMLRPEPIEGLPEIEEVGQGGLLDIALHPDFAENRILYISYAGKQGGHYGTEVARLRFVEDRLEGLDVLLVLQPKSGGGRHFGSRLVFDRQGLLYVTSGDRGDPDKAQDRGNMYGSVLRIRDDGEVPEDNPFVGQAGVRPEIYSYGHRNPQGMTRRPGTDQIWAVEHGPRGGDELNLVRAGVNYGWPVITYGRSYAGFSIGEGSEKEGMAQPAKYWVPSISPSGLTFYDGAAFPQWRGNLFLGALSGEILVRLELDGDRVAHEERLLEDFGERIRDVRQGPDGFLYILTDSGDGQLLRLEPAG
ncbi:MAG: PQQ-dependent sugar dehydrogenase [Kiloniellales bacterium]|nr:PQQ-dependent sugar dehydrogenase [Kiloniellales bacterium]